MSGNGTRTGLRVRRWLNAVNTSPLRYAGVFGSFRQALAEKPPVSHGTCQ